MLALSPRSTLVRTWWLLLPLAACTTPPGSVMETGASSTTTTEAPTTSSPGVTSTSGPPTTSTAGADTTGTTGTAGSETTDTDGDFIPKPDGCFNGGPGGQSWHCQVIECLLVEQDCPRGEKCMPWANDGGASWTSSRCTPLARDPVPPGGTCTVEGNAVSGIDDCEVASICWGVDPETDQGTCAAFCDPLGDLLEPCAEPSRCVALNEGYVPLCLVPCNPLQDGACPDGEACRHVESDGAFLCLPLVGGEVMGSAEHCGDETCLPSQACLPPRLLPGCASTCCTDLCDLGDPDGDAACAAIDPTLACEPFYEPGTAPPGLELVGVCAGIP